MPPTYFLSRTLPRQAWVVDPKYSASSLEKIRRLAQQYADEHKTPVNIHWSLTTRIVQTMQPRITREARQ